MHRVVAPIVLLLASCSTTRPTLDQVAPPQVAIETVPKSCAVAVDGSDRGTSPLLFNADSKEAVHRLTFTHEGYLASEISLSGDEIAKHSGQQVLVFLRPGTWPEKSKLIESDNPAMLTKAGLDLSKAGRPTEALPYLKRAIEVNAKFAPAHKELGTVYGKLKRNKEALEHYKIYLTCAPPDAPDLAKVRAVVDSAQGDFDMSPHKSDE
jgi:tetratricopeptide (TPR) repeat protein